MLKQTTIIVLKLLVLTLLSLDAFAAKKPPRLQQCKSKWVLTTPQAQSFGAFVVETGPDTLVMNSSGNVTTGGNATLSSMTPTSTFSVTIDNTKSRTVCGTFGFDISWGVLPAALTGPGTSMPLTEVYVTEPTLLPTPTALPVTLSTANLPITLTFQGKLGVSFPQISGLYTSPSYTVDLTQSGRTISVSNTTTATSLTPISVAETASMNFGTVAGGSAAGTVIIDTSNGRTITGSAQILSTGPGAAGAFQITGEPSLTYSLSVTGPAILKNGGGQQMTANVFTENSLGTLPVGGTETFQIGSTLNIAPLQAPGTYSTVTGGTPYQVTVNYN